MNETYVPVPEGRRGRWSVERFQVSDSEARFGNLRAALKGRGGINAGTYTKLVCDREIVMSDTPDELRDFQLAVRMATGRVLVNGLGLGLVVGQMLSKADVLELTVVEVEADVIELVGDHYRDPRLTIVHADAYAYQPPRGKRYDAVWHDIWPYISGDNYPGILRLRKKYAQRTRWQACWCEDESRDMR